jgi:CheY-like chemotaxis protein
MASPDEKENRRVKRFPLKGNILVNGKMMFKCIDISEGGLYVYTARSFEESKVFDVTLPIKNSPLTVKARVQHCQPGVGIGLQFIDLTDEQRTKIKRLINNLIMKSIKPIDQKKKILLVEDNDISRQIYKSNLLMEGFSIIEVRDGKEAIECIKTRNPDLIIMNLYMEKIDGFKILETLKTNSEWSAIPVIVFTADSSPDIKKKVLDAGADICMVKMATTPAVFVKTVKNLLLGNDKTEKIYR